MTTRSNGPAAGFGWLKQGFTAGFRHPRPLLGGAALIIVASLLPSVITLPLQFHQVTAGAPPSPTVMVWSVGLSMLFGLLLVPLYGGYLQVIDAAERGLPARARDIFTPYRNGQALPLIGYGLAIIVVYIALLGIIIAAAGGGIASWYMEALNAQAAHMPPPALPRGFGIAILMFAVFGLIMMGFYAISLGQIALSRRGVFSAMADGVTGAFKNLLPLLVFAVCVFVAWIVLAIVFAIAAMIVLLIAKLAGAWLILLLAVPLYIAMMMAMFAVMFGVTYHLWRDVCGEVETIDAMPQVAI